MERDNFFPGKVYTVTSPNGCTVYDNDGLTLVTVEADKQASFVATTSTISWTDEEAKITATFKCAPAKLMALGLLGGGASAGGSTLPAGYIAAEFLESDGVSAVVDSLITPDFETGIFVKMHALNTEGTPYFLGTQNNSGLPSIWVMKNTNELSIRYNTSYFSINSLKETVFEAKINWLNSKTVETSLGQHELTQEVEPPWLYHLTFFRATYKANTRYDNGSQARFYYIKMSQGADIVRDMIPCISPDGVGCMYDMVTKQPFKNAATGSFIAGFTLAQARKLGNLPATGGTLTISLPSGYDSDSGVVAALETARANGWTLTIQTYTPETGTAMARTFAFRRIWVRRTQNANGAYVSANGSRWQVDWCVDMLTPDGSTPDAHGYELFRSTEAAVAYWELTPYVDPEAEEMMQNELLTNSTTK